MTQLWVEKYRPKRVAEVVGNKQSVQQFISWMRSWETGRPQKKAALLYGPAGVGKTSLVLAYGNEHGYDVVEVNASDWRDQEHMKSIVGSSSQQLTLQGTAKRIILVDEVDGIAGREDAGGLSALRRIIDETRVPIVMVANNPWDQRLATIRDRSLLIEFKRLSKTDIISRLREICRREGLECDEQVLRALAERAEGDLRSAINDLQAIAQGKKKVTVKDLEALGSRNRVKQIFEALRIIFNAKSLRSARAALEGLEVDLDTVYTWILDNAPLQIQRLDELADAMEVLARADLYLARMSREQKWRLMRYAVPLMTGGVALSRKTKPKGFVKFSFPDKIRFMQKTREERELLQSIARKVAAQLHLSSHKAMKYMVPFLRVIASSSTRNAEALAEYLSLSPKEVEYLAGKPLEAVAKASRGRRGGRSPSRG